MADYVVAYDELDALLLSLPENTAETAYSVELSSVTADFITGSSVIQRGTLQWILYYNSGKYVSLSFGAGCQDVFAAKTRVKNMFNGCTSLVAAEIPPIPVATDADYMFVSCTSLVSAKLPPLPNVVSSNSMFSNCTSLESVELPSMPAVTNVGFMFNGCTSLVSAKLPPLPNVVNSNTMFSNCTSLESVELPSMPAVTNVGSMFNGCTSLVSVELPPVPSVRYASLMFNGCTSLREVHGWSLPPSMKESDDGVVTTRALFSGCTSLEAVYVRPDTPSADAETWRSFLVSHGSGTDDTVTVYATDGTVEASASVTNADGRSVEATDWVDELALSDTEIPGSKVADMMATRMPITGNTDVADPGEDTFTLWARDGDRLRTNVVQMTDSDFNDIFS